MNLTFQLFTGIGCSDPSGCSIIFDKDAVFQYFPSNTSNYFIPLNGDVTFNYSDGTQYVSSATYSNTWINYQDVWKYNVSFDAKVSLNKTFANIKFKDDNKTSDCTLKIKKIENETFVLSTEKASVLFVYGSNFQYNGNNVTSNSNNNIFGFGNRVGSVKTHEVTSTTPLILMFLEKT
jgi:hypothetical protein